MGGCGWVGESNSLMWVGGSVGGRVGRSNSAIHYAGGERMRGHSFTDCTTHFTHFTTRFTTHLGGGRMRGQSMLRKMFLQPLRMLQCHRQGIREAASSIFFALLLVSAQVKIANLLTVSKQVMLVKPAYVLACQRAFGYL